MSLPPICFFDLETRSEVDIKKHGLWRYATDPSTSILCIGLKFAGGPNDGLEGVWAPPEWRALADGSALEVDESLVIAWNQHVSGGGFVCAHNAQFDRRVMVELSDRRAVKFALEGWGSGQPAWPLMAPAIDQTLCSQALAESYSLPGKLGKAAQILRLPVQKLTTGKRLIQQLSDARVPWGPDRATLEAFWDYALKDVLTMEKLFFRCRPWAGVEWADYHVVERMNDRGMAVDVEFAERATQYGSDEIERLNQELKKLTGDPNITLSHSKKKVDWLYALLEGSELQSSMIVDTVRKRKKVKAKSASSKVMTALQERLEDLEERGSDYDDGLGPEKRDQLRAFMDILERGNGVAGKKFVRMRDLAVEGRAHHQFRCSPTITGRHSSRGVQFDNVIRDPLQDPRGELEDPALYVMDQLMEGGEGVVSALEERFNLPFQKLLSRCLRPCVMAPEGRYLVWGDWNAVEPRTVAWLAGHDKTVELWASGEPVYSIQAARMFGGDPRDIEKGAKSDDAEMAHLRLAGKVCVAEGEPVLTQRGLVPVEKIRCCDKVWDGVEWVSHDGLQFNGWREVITYDGLTATPDHLVHTRAGWMALEEAARCAHALTRSGDGRTPLRPSRRAGEAEGVASHRRVVRVYDLVNAGPRHRFTASGRLVHNCVIALNYQGGANALLSMARNYGMRLTERDAEEYKRRYRAANPWLTRYWELLDIAMWSAIQSPSGEAFHAGKLRYQKMGRDLWCVLPDGRPIVYPDVKVEQKYKERFDAVMTVVTYRKRFGDGVVRGELYPGVLIENGTQGADASLLRDLMRRLDARGWALIGSTHDEVRAEVDAPEIEEAVAELKTEMERVPSWAHGLPLKAEVKWGSYYEK